MASNSGGGITSNKLKQVPVRTGQAAGGKNPGYAGQPGEAQGNKVMNKIGTMRGGVEPMHTAAPIHASSAMRWR